jgi:hypothetical protein
MSANGRMAAARTLAGKVLDDVGRMVRYESELARTEMSEKARSIGIGVGLLVGAILLLPAFVGALVATAIIALALILPGWAAALVVCGVLLLLIGVLAGIGVASLRKGMPPTPKQAISTTKENLKWVRARLRSVRG